MLLLLLVFLL